MAAASSPVVTIYKNGDRNFHGKKIVVNRRYYRNFENFLDKITQDTRAGVAVRKIHTPHHGTKIESLESIQDGATYVAAGSEKFRQLSYGEISKSPVTSSSPSNNHHSKTVAAAESRYKKEAMAEPLKNRIIFVYRNGEKKTAPIRLLVDKRSLSSMDVFLQYISDKIKLTGGAVKYMYSLDTMAKVADVADIKTNMSYVAVGSGKTFAKGKYGEDGVNHASPERRAKKKTTEDGRVVNTGSTYTLPPPEDEKVVTTPDMLSPMANTYDADELKTPIISENLAADIADNVPNVPSVLNELADSDSPVLSNTEGSEPLANTATPPPPEAAPVVAVESLPVRESTQILSDKTERNDINGGQPIEHSNTAESETMVQNSIEKAQDGAKGDDKLEKSVDENIEVVTGEPAEENLTVEEDADEEKEEVQNEALVEHQQVEKSDDIETGDSVSIEEDKNIVAANDQTSEEDTTPEIASEKTSDENIESENETTNENFIPEDSTTVEMSTNDDNAEPTIDDSKDSTEDKDTLPQQGETEPELESVELEKEENEVFKASGQQEESGEQIMDDKNTTVEELIDKVPAVEVEEDLSDA